MADASYQAGKNDRSGFEIELVALIPMLQSWARRRSHDREAANDLLQDTLVRALQSRESFRDGTNLRGWLFLIMRNLAADRGRRHSRQGQHLSLDRDDIPLAVAPRQDSGLAIRDLQRAFERLPAVHQELVLRVVAGGESYEELASAYGIAVGTVKSRMARARTQLRAELSLQQQESPEAARERGPDETDRKTPEDL